MNFSNTKKGDCLVSRFISCVPTYLSRSQTSVLSLLLSPCVPDHRCLHQSYRRGGCCCGAACRCHSIHGETGTVPHSAAAPLQPLQPQITAGHGVKGREIHRWKTRNPETSLQKGYCAILDFYQLELDYGSANEKRSIRSQTRIVSRPSGSHWGEILDLVTFLPHLSV